MTTHSKNPFWERKTRGFSFRFVRQTKRTKRKPHAGFHFVLCAPKGAHTKRNETDLGVPAPKEQTKRYAATPRRLGRRWPTGGPRRVVGEPGGPSPSKPQLAPQRPTVRKGAICQTGRNARPLAPIQ